MRTTKVKTIKQPDRFTKTVEAWWKSLPQGKLIDVNTEMAKLLRNEHEAVVRMVQDQYRFANEMGLSKQGYKDLLIKILTERAK